MFDNCPHDHFAGGPRSSSLRFEVDLDVKHVQHPVCQLAAASHDVVNAGTAHTRVQRFMLEHDQQTIASEVPLWMMPEEFSLFKRCFPGETLPLSGHVDALGFDREHVWIWDYKPRARREKHAHLQVYMYALMLSIRAGVPLEMVRCGYFDEQDCFVFTPQQPREALAPLAAVPAR